MLKMRILALGAACLGTAAGMAWGGVNKTPATLALKPIGVYTPGGPS